MGEQRPKLAQLFALRSAIRHEGALELARKFVAAVRGEGVRPALRRLCIYNARLSDDQSEPVSEPQEERDVLFVSACPGGTRRYRCQHAIEALRLAGFTADMLCFPARSPEAWLATSKAIVLQRVPFDAKVGAFIAAARARGVPVFFDIDDLLFDEEHADELDAGSCERDFERGWARSHARRIGMGLERADHVLVSTPGIAAAVHARFAGKRVTIVPNVASSAMKAAADAARAARAGDAEARVRIGFFSGTPTHDEAFASIAPVLDRLLSRHERLQLRLVGPVRLPALLERHGPRIEQLDLVAPDAYARALADVDIHVAPLRARAFDEAKSALKWLEAGLVGRPLVASALGEYARWIDCGRSGFACQTLDDWARSLERLIVEPDLPACVGQRAHEVVVKNFTTARAARTWACLFDCLLRGRSVQPSVGVR